MKRTALKLHSAEPPPGRHNVRVAALDDVGNAASRTWSFRVVRR